jgi:hypothetical protein
MTLTATTTTTLSNGATPHRRDHDNNSKLRKHARFPKQQLVEGTIGMVYHSNGGSCVACGVVFANFVGRLSVRLSRRRGPQPWPPPPYFLNCDHELGDDDQLALRDRCRLGCVADVVYAVPPPRDALVLFSVWFISRASCHNHHHIHHHRAHHRCFAASIATSAPQSSLRSHVPRSLTHAVTTTRFDNRTLFSCSRKY